MQLFFLTNLLSPYRVEWLNRLAQSVEIDAFFVQSDEKTRTGEWLSSCVPRFRTEQVTETDKLLKLLKNSSYDIYLVDGYSSALKLKVIRLLQKQKKRFFINIDGIDVWRKKGIKDILKSGIKRRVYRSGAYFLCGSRIAADTVISQGANKDRVFVHPFTSLCEKDVLTPERKDELQRECKKLLNREDKKIVLAVGRFIPLKQYDRLIEAWKDMPDDCVLYIIGGGEERPHYEELIRRLDVKSIELLDFMLPEKLSTYFRAADLFVHTSSTETWGLVINEAMANGCPVIATDHCVGAVELIRNGEEGYLIGVGDVDALRERMLRVLGDDILRERMKENVIQRIMPYTYENLAATHLKIFNETAR